MIWIVLALLAGYVLGAVPYGFLIVKLLYGDDVRTAGSGSIGATNVTRRAGLKAGALTYLFDVGKGIASVAIMRSVTDDPWWVGAAALAAIVGHMYPVFLRFKGGKGVATGVGVYLGIAPLAVVSTLVLWGLIFWRTRMVSLASIVATLAVPFWIGLWYLVTGRPAALFPTVVMASVGCALVVAKHHENIRRMREGTESRFEGSSAKPAEGHDREPVSAGREAEGR